MAFDIDDDELRATRELMKSANEMFKELGYTQKNPYTDEIEIIYRHYATAYVIRFWKNTQAVIKQTEDGWSRSINMQELQAINKKCKELKWI